MRSEGATWLGAAARVCVVGAGAMCLGCEFSRGPITLKSDDPVIRIPAMKIAVETDHARSMPAMVRALDDTDPAIRMFAIICLQKMTGTTLGYVYYDDELSREPSVAAWRVLVGLPPKGLAATRATTGPATSAPADATTAPATAAPAMTSAAPSEVPAKRREGT